MILDTCGFIWLATGSEDLSYQTRQAIKEAKMVYVSSISSFEVGNKYAAGQLNLPCDPDKWYHDILLHHDITEIPVDGKIALAATKLPPFHRDPCDRFIIASAKLMRLSVVTHDRRFEAYGIEILQ